MMLQRLSIRARAFIVAFSAVVSAGYVMAAHSLRAGYERGGFTTEMLAAIMGFAVVLFAFSLFPSSFIDRVFWRRFDGTLTSARELYAPGIWVGSFLALIVGCMMKSESIVLSVLSLGSTVTILVANFNDARARRLSASFGERA